jgi:hypothetical protein
MQSKFSVWLVLSTSHNLYWVFLGSYACLFVAQWMGMCGVRRAKQLVRGRCFIFGCIRMQVQKFLQGSWVLTYCTKKKKKWVFYIFFIPSKTLKQNIFYSTNKIFLWTPFFSFFPFISVTIFFFIYTYIFIKNN